MNLNSTARFFSCIAFVATVGVSTLSTAQEPKSTIDEIRDYQESFVVIQSVDQFKEHAGALLTDLGYGVFRDSAESLFKFENEDEYDTKRPVIFYSDANFREIVVQLPVKSMDLVKKRAGTDVKDVTKVFPTRNIGFERTFYYVDPLYAVVQESRLLFGDEKSWVEDYLDSQPIERLLNGRFQKLINESGVLYFTKVTEGNHPKLASNSNIAKQKITAEEQTTLKQIDKVFESAKHTAVGFTYDKKCVALQGLVAFKNLEAAKKVFDFEAAGRGFRPTIGLSKKNLISSASFQIETLRSPETIRLIPKILQAESWLLGGSEKWLKGDSIEVAMQLIADTWHDVKGVRVGLYENDDVAHGPLCIVGIVDPKDPDAVIDEFRKLVAIVENNENVESSKDREIAIANLIKDLGSRDYNIRQRATTRLMLAGRESVEAIRAATKSDSAEIRMRAQQLIRKLENESDRATETYSVNSTEFWSNLRPKFSMEKEKTKYGQHVCDLLRVHPDPGKTEKEIREATETMVGIFGPSWDKVPMIRVKDRFVFMFGSNPKLLDEVVANLRADKDPIATSELSQRQNISPGQFQIQVSIARFMNTYFAGKLRKKFDVGENNLTTLTLSLDPDTWGANLHMPVEELKTLIDYQMGKYRASDDF